MKYLRPYKLFEAFGVAEATLAYNDFIVNDFKSCLESFMSQDEGKDDTKIRTYKEQKTYTQKDLSEFIKRVDWPKFPISGIKVEYSLEIVPDEIFKKKYPTTSLTKNYVGTGGYYSIGEEDGSTVQPAIDDRTEFTININIEVGATVTNSFTDIKALLVEVESAVTHELNHAYESINRWKSGKASFSTDVTWALEANRAKVRKDIFKMWADDIGFYLYWSELHELNAMIQDAWPYVKRFELQEMKQKTPTWRFAQRMIDFSANQFKQKMIDKIRSVYPDTDVEMVLKRIKNGFANELIKMSEKPKKAAEDKPSISGEMVRKMSVDQFLKFVEDRCGRAGKKLQSKVLNLYSLKLKYKQDEKN